MFLDLNSISELPELHADICIVGAGAAGITLALELIATRKDILLLEGGALNFQQASQSLYSMKVISPHYFDPMQSRLRFFGGSTNHWDGSVRAFDPIDFEYRPWVADSGWPFGYSDLQRYYDRAFSYVEAGKWQNNEQPFTRPLRGYQEKLAKRGFGFRLAYDSPPTRFGERYLQQLRSAPNVSIAVNANLLSINEAKDRRTVEGLTIGNYKGHRTQVKARIYVIALGGMENARALLLSDAVTPGGLGNEYDLVGRYFMDHPVVESVVLYPGADFKRVWGTGDFKLGGKDYRLACQATEEALRRHQLTNARMPLDWANELYTSEGIESAHELSSAVAHGSLGHVLRHLGNMLKDSDLIFGEWWRQRGHDAKGGRAEEFGGYISQMMIEQRPNRDNRIVLTNNRDALGLKKGEVIWRLSGQEKEDLTRLIALFAKAVGAEGVGIVHSLLEQDDSGRRLNQMMNFGHHHMGTTRAHANARKGVVDGNQRIHGRENIFVAGSSVFPTGSHVPPTATIVATTIRLAEHLKGKLV